MGFIIDGRWGRRSKLDAMLNQGGIIWLCPEAAEGLASTARERPARPTEWLGIHNQSSASILYLESRVVLRAPDSVIDFCSIKRAVCLRCKILAACPSLPVRFWRRAAPLAGCWTAVVPSLVQVHRYTPK